jgi:hypothetical protein
VPSFYNSTLGAVQLNATYTSGNYTSKIFDATANSQWNNISWTEGAPYGEELPDNQYDEKAAGILGGANMTGNMLLYHFNNDSAYGENNTHVYDFSGSGNNGTAQDAEPTSNGKFNGGFSFIPTDDHLVKVNSALDTSGSFTIEAWADLSSTGTYQTFYYQGASGSWQELITLDSVGNFKIWWRNGTNGDNLGYTMENFEKLPPLKTLKKSYNQRELMEPIMRKKMHKLSPKTLKA